MTVVTISRMPRCKSRSSVIGEQIATSAAATGAMPRALFARRRFIFSGQQQHREGRLTEHLFEHRHNRLAGARLRFVGHGLQTQILFEEQLQTRPQSTAPVTDEDT